MGREVVFFEDEFLESLLPMMSTEFRKSYASKKRQEKRDAAKAAPAAAAAGKKAPAPGAAAAGAPPLMGGGFTTPAAMRKMVALAESAVTGLTRQQSQSVGQLARQGSTSHKWQFKMDSGAWADYAPAANKEVEKAYASWLVNPHVDVRSVHSGDWHYMIDFNLNQQQNIQHAAHKIRDIRRVAL
jgi:hypothetical protein